MYLKRECCELWKPVDAVGYSLKVNGKARLTRVKDRLAVGFLADRRLLLLVYRHAAHHEAGRQAWR